ncbi:CRISPR-associated protein Csx19 [Desulfococcaceae bacterium HSG8]|nr:CRISPR-associated protein Csx19 [Desulfococcaceae bacterium HSG8]
MEANGLELKTIHSETVPVSVSKENLNSIIQSYFDDKSFAVAYLDYAVLIGTWENNAFHFPENKEPEPEYIQKLRVFNLNRELLIWRTRNSLKGRLRADGENGTETEVVVAHQVLFGTRKGSYCNNSFTEITEDRGTSLILPFANLIVNDKRNRIRIRTHNYVNALGQTTYEDCRFVCFTDDEGFSL